MRTMKLFSGRRCMWLISACAAIAMTACAAPASNSVRARIEKRPSETFICPPATHSVAPCECKAVRIWARLLCEHMPDFKFVQQVLFQHFLNVLTPWLKIEDSSVGHLPETAFLGARITRLEIVNTGLESIDKDAFAGLETSLKILIIRGNRLEEIPSASLTSLKQLKTLSLNGNEISHVYNDSFAGMDRLKSVSLAINKIHTLESGAFVNFRHVSLSYNQLTSLEGAFRHLPMLQWLFLAGNRLTNFKDQFAYLPSLKFLLAQENDIERIGSDLRALDGVHWIKLGSNKLTDVEDCFSHFPELERLSLSNNKISRISSETFSKLSKLQNLDLAHNRISSLRRMFSHLKALRSLDLSGNRITSLGSGDLDFSETLMEINLSRNKLKRLDKHSFANLAKTLTKLDLSRNMIGTMERAFRQLEMVREINLEHNNITTLHTLDFPCTCKTKLTLLKLKGNPLECTRDLKNVLEEMRENKDLTISGVLECDERVFSDDEVLVMAQQLLNEEIMEEIDQIETDARIESLEGDLREDRAKEKPPQKPLQDQPIEKLQSEKPSGETKPRSYHHISPKKLQEKQNPEATIT